MAFTKKNFGGNVGAGSDTAKLFMYKTADTKAATIASGYFNDLADIVKVGDVIIASEAADIVPGNAMSIRSSPLGTWVHNVELKIAKGGQLARSAGTYAMIAAKDGKYAQLRLPSGEVRLVQDYRF